MLFLHHADDTRRIRRVDARDDNSFGCGGQGLAEHHAHRELACVGEPADGRGRHGIDGRRGDVLWLCMLNFGQRQRDTDQYRRHCDVLWRGMLSSGQRPRDAGDRGSCFLHEWEIQLVDEERGQPAVNRDYIMLGEFSVPC